jgi:mevalonate kinase
LKKRFYSNGKLLLAGEYAVLEGATALALPTVFGQSMEVEYIDEPIINWKSYDHQGNIWFHEKFSIKQGNIIPLILKSPLVTERLLQLFKTVIELNPKFLRHGIGCAVSSILEFPNDWGLGSSSTLVNNIAQWTNIDPFKLLHNSFGGSGYDVAAARINNPFLYSLKEEPKVQKIDLQWDFKDKLYFVHLNEKQNSREAIDLFQKVKENSTDIISEINAITLAITTCRSLKVFMELIDQHEKIIAKLIDRTPVKDLFFKDYSGSVKSLGAWGGDFVLVTSENKDLDYFRNMGYTTIIPFKDMIK